MNIVFSALSNIPVFNGMETALLASGEEVINWNRDKKPVYDMLEELQPSYLFISSKQLDRAALEAIPEYKDVKLILYGTNIPEEIASQTKLVIVPQQVPDTLMRNISGCDNIMKLKKAVNLVQFSGGYYDDKLSSDILYITNSGTEQRPYIHAHLSGLLYHLNYSLKIIGGFKLAAPQYVGRTSMKETLNFIKSTKIVLDYDWDIALDIIGNKTLPISNVKNDLIPFYNTEYEFVNIIQEYTKNEKLRRKTIKKAYDALIDKDTYFHRVYELGNILGETTWQTKAIDTLARYRK